MAFINIVTPCSRPDSYMPEVLQAVRDCLGEPIEIFSDTSWIVKL